MKYMLALLVAASFVFAGCEAGTDESATVETTTETTPAGTDATPTPAP
jgi:hypothetical protein